GDPVDKLLCTKGSFPGCTLYIDPPGIQDEQPCIHPGKRFSNMVKSEFEIAGNIISTHYYNVQSR
ncbi:MAG: hypothetical protein WCI48_13840, partial [Bacteroidota bacterium]